MQSFRIVACIQRASADVARMQRARRQLTSRTRRGRVQAHAGDTPSLISASTVRPSSRAFFTGQRGHAFSRLATGCPRTVGQDHLEHTPENTTAAPRQPKRTSPASAHAQCPLSARRSPVPPPKLDPNCVVTLANESEDMQLVVGTTLFRVDGFSIYLASSYDSAFD